jgi:hypothetical protein
VPVLECNVSRYVNNQRLETRVEQMLGGIYTFRFINVFDHFDVEYRKRGGDNDSSQRSLRDVIEIRRQKQQRRHNSES